MAKIFKITGYLVDANGDLDAEDLKAEIDNSDLINHHVEIDEVDIGEWDDDNPLNYHNCPLSECEKYFAKEV